MLYFVTWRKVLSYNVYQWKYTMQLSGYWHGEDVLFFQPTGQGRDCHRAGETSSAVGRREGLYVPFLLPNKSWEFIFTLANYPPKTMQGRFSLAYSVSVWAYLNIEKSKIFIILLDSNSSIIIIIYDYLCQSFLASFLWPLNCKSF